MLGLKKIVVRSPNWIGDHVMAYDAYRALREHIPGVELTLLAPENLADLPFSEIFHRQLLIRERRSLRESIRLAVDLRREAFDLAVIFPSSLRSTLPHALARVPRRVGYKSDLGALFLTESIAWKGARDGRHKSDLYFELAQKAVGKTLLRQTIPLRPVPVHEDRIILAPGASIELREWPYFSELITLLRAHYPQTRLTLVGSKSERRWLNALAPVIDANVEDKIGQTSLTELVEMCQKSKLVVANDSGIAHLSGTLAQASTLVLFGPGNPEYIRPVGPRVYDCRIEVKCSPCDKSHCKAPYGFKRCLIDLSAQMVMGQVRQILG